MTGREKGPPPTRERIVDAALHLFQQRGYHGVGTAEIASAARAPKGSLYHHFPDGKQQIAAVAVARIAGDAVGAIRALSAAGKPAEAVVRRIARDMARWLEATAFREGSLLASVAHGADSDLPILQTALRDALAALRAELQTLLVRDGVTRAAARGLAASVLSALEGALAAARIEHDARVVVEVADQLAKLIARHRE